MSGAGKSLLPRWHLPGAVLPPLPQPLLGALGSGSGTSRACNYGDGGEAGEAAVGSGGEQLLTKRGGGGGRGDLFTEVLQRTPNLSFSWESRA